MELATSFAHKLTLALRRLSARISRAFDQLPIRVRLAGVSAALTFVILCMFAVFVGSLTAHRIRSDFNREVTASSRDLTALLQFEIAGGEQSGYRIRVVTPDLNKFAAAEHAAIRVLTPTGSLIAATRGAPNFGIPSRVTYGVVNAANIGGYRVQTRVEPLGSPIGGTIIVQYGRRLSDLQSTIARVKLLLVLGVLIGTGMALIAGLMIARRAMAPIAQLTNTAAEIARTRDPSRTVPQSPSHDEVSELARTLQNMLTELDLAHAETEAMLTRQRQFVADASHELRTPLTSVLANLELLAETLRGEQGEAASSALRSSQRMRRLVADLLLLARTDVGRVVRREPVDLAQVIVEAAGELGPVSAAHDITLEISPAVVHAARDDLHRLSINLIENALRHTPAATHVWVITQMAAGDAQLIVEDDGPGVPADLQATLFDRFVRGAGDRGGSFGLGLAIVKAVAESHGGSVRVESSHRHGVTSGARFVVTLPLAPVAERQETGAPARLAAGSH